MSPAIRLETLTRELGAGRFVELPDLRVHYARLGAGRPVILLHGWPEFWLTWRRNLPALAQDFDVVAPDQRGFGDSLSRNRPAGAPLTPEILADDLVGLMDALGLRRAAVVAHDVGAVAAQSLARRHPDRVVGLFFFNCPYPGIAERWAGADALPHTWYQYFNQTPLALKLAGYNRDTVELYIGHILSAWSRDPGAFESDLALWTEVFAREGRLESGFAWYKGIDAARRQSIREGAPVLPRIAHPTRVYWGRHDPVLRAEWVDGLPAYFETIRCDLCDDAGHFVHYERPEDANREMRRFLNDPALDWG